MRGQQLELLTCTKQIKGLNVKSKTKTNKSAATEIKTKSEKSVPDAEGKATKILESDVQKMSAEQYEKNADMIMDAIRSGNFIYDLSVQLDKVVDKQLFISITNIN